MYPSIPYVSTELPEPGCINELEEAAVRFLFVPITDIIFWEHQGYHRAHTVDNQLVEEIAMCCMYEKMAWEEWSSIKDPD